MIAMYGGSGNGQRRRHWWRDGNMITIGNGMALALWMAQWVANNCCERRSGAMRGDARLTVVAITMDSDGMITTDGDSGNWQWQRNGWQDGKVMRWAMGWWWRNGQHNGWQTITSG
jgi:hypothetical protein